MLALESVDEDLLPRMNLLLSPKSYGNIDDEFTTDMIIMEKNAPGKSTVSIFWHDSIYYKYQKVVQYRDFRRRIARPKLITN